MAWVREWSWRSWRSWRWKCESVRESVGLIWDKVRGTWGWLGYLERERERKAKKKSKEGSQWGSVEFWEIFGSSDWKTTWRWWGLSWASSPLLFSPSHLLFPSRLVPFTLILNPNCPSLPLCYSLTFSLSNMLSMLSPPAPSTVRTSIIFFFRAWGGWRHHLNNQNYCILSYPLGIFLHGPDLLIGLNWGREMCPCLSLSFLCLWFWFCFFSFSLLLPLRYNPSVIMKEWLNSRTLSRLIYGIWKL